MRFVLCYLDSSELSALFDYYCGTKKCNKCKTCDNVDANIAGAGSSSGNVLGDYQIRTGTCSYCFKRIFVAIAVKTVVGKLEVENVCGIENLEGESYNNLIALLENVCFVYGCGSAGEALITVNIGNGEQRIFALPRIGSGSDNCCDIFGKNQFKVGVVQIEHDLRKLNVICSYFNSNINGDILACFPSFGTGKSSGESGIFGSGAHHRYVDISVGSKISISYVIFLGVAVRRIGSKINGIICIYCGCVQVDTNEIIEGAYLHSTNDIEPSNNVSRAEVGAFIIRYAVAVSAAGPPALALSESRPIVTAVCADNDLSFGNGKIRRNTAAGSKSDYFISVAGYVLKKSSLIPDKVVSAGLNDKGGNAFVSAGLADIHDTDIGFKVSGSLNNGFAANSLDSSINLCFTNAHPVAGSNDAILNVSAVCRTFDRVLDNGYVCIVNRLSYAELGPVFTIVGNESGDLGNGCAADNGRGSVKNNFGQIIGCAEIDSHPAVADFFIVGAHGVEAHPSSAGSIIKLMCICGSKYAVGKGLTVFIRICYGSIITPLPAFVLSEQLRGGVRLACRNELDLSFNFGSGGLVGSEMLSRCENDGAVLFIKNDNITDRETACGPLCCGERILLSFAGKSAAGSNSNEDLAFTESYGAGVSIGPRVNVISGNNVVAGSILLCNGDLRVLEDKTGLTVISGKIKCAFGKYADTGEGTLPSV